MTESSEYVVGHVQEALAHAGETDVHVRVIGDHVVVTGTVATEARRAAVVDIAREVGGLDVRDDVTVLRPAAPTGEQEALS